MSASIKDPNKTPDKPEDSDIWIPPDFIKWKRGIKKKEPYFPPNSLDLPVPLEEPPLGPRSGEDDPTAVNYSVRSDLKDFYS